MEKFNKKQEQIDKEREYRINKQRLNTTNFQTKQNSRSLLTTSRTEVREKSCDEKELLKNSADEGDKKDHKHTLSMQYSIKPTIDKEFNKKEQNDFTKYNTYRSSLDRIKEREEAYRRIRERNNDNKKTLRGIQKVRRCNMRKDLERKFSLKTSRKKKPDNGNIFKFINVT